MSLFRNTFPPNISAAVLICVIAVCMFIFLNQKSFLPTGISENVNSIENGNIPPSLALTTIALGPLKGLIANVLWWRIIEQQDEGNYFEIIQLADWITTLQPDNPKVWVFQAWNMAYNVAYQFPDGNSKWKWIYQSMKLLAEDGLKNNRNNETICKEIARIYYDRIGSQVDPGFETFRKKLALIVIKYLPDGSGAELEKLLSAPKNEKELRKDPETNILLETAGNFGVNLLAPRDFYNYKNWKPEQKKTIEAIPGSATSMAKIDFYLRAKGLRDELAVDPERMFFIDREFGPFDWRLFQAYVVYWAARGSFDDFLKQGTSASPMIRQAMTSSFLEGKLIFDPAAGVLVTTSNFKIVGKLHDYYEYMMEYHYSKQIDYLHKAFLEQAAAVLYTFNQMDAAMEIYEHYQKGYGGESVDFETFIAENLFKTLHNKTFRNQKVLVESSLFQAYNWLATGDVQRAMGYANFAKLIWARHQKQNQNNPATQLPPFNDLKQAAYKKFMESNVAQEFKNRLVNISETKEFQTQTEKVDTGELSRKMNVYEKRATPLEPLKENENLLRESISGEEGE